MPTRFWATSSGHGTAASPKLSRADNSALCATWIPNRTFAKPYVSRPVLSHARSSSGAASPGGAMRSRNGPCRG